MLPDEPTEIDLAASGILTRRDDVSGRHRRPRRHQPYPAQRRSLDPVGGVQPCGRKDDCDLALRVREGSQGELSGQLKRRIRDDVGAPYLCGEKILGTLGGIEAAIGNVAPGRLHAGLDGLGHDGAKATGGIMDAGAEILFPEQSRATPCRLYIVLVNLAFPNVGLALALYLTLVQSCSRRGNSASCSAVHGS